MTLNLSDYAWNGYDAPERTYGYMPGSDAFIAWRVGRWMRVNGDARPALVVSGEGYRVIVDGARVIEVWEDSEPQDVTLR